MRQNNLLKVLTIVIVLLLCVTSCQFDINLFPEQVRTTSTEPQKPDEIKYSKGLEYKLLDDGTGYQVTGKGTCRDLELVIPREYQGLPVVSIGNRAFEEQSMFSVAIPDTVVEICDLAFSSASIRGTLNIPGSVKTIGNNAFANCKSIKKLVLEDGVETISHSAFFNCERIEVISISKSVKTIYSDSFSNNLSLLSIEVDDENPYFKDIDGNLYSKDGKQLIHYAHGKESKNFVVPDGVVEIGEYAFEGNIYLLSVELPDTVETIGYRAFFGVRHISELTLPLSLKNIGAEAFGSSIDILYYKGTMMEWVNVIKEYQWNGMMKSYRLDAIDGYYDYPDGFVIWK